MRSRLHQFILSPEPVHPNPDWLFHCPTLLVTKATDQEGNHWAFLGLAIETRQTQSTPSQQLAQLHDR